MGEAGEGDIYSCRHRVREGHGGSVLNSAITQTDISEPLYREFELLNARSAFEDPRVVAFTRHSEQTEIQV
jgi:hypothetical protein